MKQYVTYGIRTSMILFWCGVIYLFLLIPTVFQSFWTQRSISILAWPSLLTPEFLKDFERTTKIKVYVTYFENNEELIIKMRSGSASGYDLIMPADYVVSLLTKESLLKKIDRNKLSFWPLIGQGLIGHPFDKNNDYTIPYAWSVYGIVFDRTVLMEDQLLHSWSLLFDPAIATPVGMIDDGRELISMASLYLTGLLPHQLTPEQWSQVTKLVIDQKKRVTMYTDLRADYLLLSGTSPIVVTNSSEISRLLVQQSHRFNFFIPQEGSFLVIDSFALPATTAKEELVYEFLNYLYKPQVMGSYVRNFGFSPAIPLAGIDAAYVLYPSLDQLEADRLRFFDDAIPENRLNDLWVRLKM